jgi:hypothetical protein
MKTLANYISEHLRKYNFSDMIGDIIFELDEASIELLDPTFVEYITEAKYINKYDKSGRIVWKGKNGDTIKLTSHATEREDRDVEHGGDGEHINETDIVNMFIYSWEEIMGLFYEGHLKKDSYGNDAWIIQCKCYLEGEEPNIKPAGARPENKHLWAVWRIYENYTTGKIDIRIVTIFRGVRINHRANQRRIVIANNGYVKQILPK